MNVTGFICALCNGEFTKVLTDEEAMLQFAKEFPGVPDGVELAMVCHDCFMVFKERE